MIAWNAASDLSFPPIVAMKKSATAAKGDGGEASTCSTMSSLLSGAMASDSRLRIATHSSSP